MIARSFVVVASLAALVATASAQFSYARRTQAIHAGVVVLEGQRYQGVPENLMPYVWFNLENNRSAKPASWTFLNPRAASTATPTVAARWNAIASGRGGPGLAVGERLTKRFGAYWEVALANVGEEEIADYDVLFLHYRAGTALNSFERERLRQFVDQGGVLWVSADGSTGPAVQPVNGLPIPFALRPIPTGNYGFDPTHPLLRNPFRIGPSEINLPSPTVLPGPSAFTLAEVGLADLELLQQTVAPDSNRLRPVAAGPGGGISVASIGDGFVVVSTRTDARLLNRAAGNVANYFAVGGEPARDPFTDAAAKFAVNLVSLRSQSPGPSGGPGRTGSSPVDVGAPLLGSFFAPTPSGGTGEFTPPALYKGLLVVSSGNRVLVYDANPASDIDGDGDPDDGVRDFAFGTGYDLLWASVPLAGPISAPTCVEVAGAPVVDQILVTTATGQLVAFDAFNRGADGRILPGPVAPLYTVSPPGGPAVGDVPYAPVAFEGFAYMADTVGAANRVGRVWVVDLRTGQNVVSNAPWMVGGTGTNVLREIDGAPTIAYVPIRDNSGGLDRVAYVATRPRSGPGGASATAGLSSLWLGVRGESPVEWQVRTQGGNRDLVVTTRAALQGLNIFRPDGSHPLGVKLTLLNSAGEPYTAAELQNIFTGTVSQTGGTLVFQMNNTATIPAETGVRVDYTIDWGTGNPAVTNQVLRGQIFLPDDPDIQRRIFPGVAIGPNGNVFVVAGAPGKHGTLFALREEGRGVFQLLYRWDLYREHTVRLNQANPYTHRETLFDEDPVTQLAGPFLSGRLGALEFKSGPVVVGDTVYVIASATKNLFIDMSIVLAFEANPAPRQIVIDPIGDRFTLVQPDIARSPDKGDPRTFSSFQMNQFQYESTGDRGVIRFDNLMTGTRGPVTNALSTSLPVILRRAGAPDEVIEPDRNGGSRWSPLRWYMSLNGYRNSSPPFATGNTVFFAGDSVLPNLLENGFSGPPTRRDGLLFALNGAFPENDPFLVPNSERPWMRQAYSLRLAANDIEPNPNILWPQYRGLTSFEDFIVRFRQTVLRGSTDAFGVVAGEGGVYAWSSAGVYGFRRADFWVADEGRVARFDSVGNPEFVIENTYFAGEGSESASATQRPLARPTKVVPLGGNELLVVDTGANRVVRLDPTGREVRSITEFQVDPNFTVDGFVANSPTRLDRPRDAIAFTSYQVSPANVSSPRPLEFWVHYVIADTGNHRIIEIVDRYEANPQTFAVVRPIALGVLNWHTPQALTGKRFEYVSVDRAFVPDGADGRYVYAAAVANARPTLADFGLPALGDERESTSGNGGIILFDGANTQIIGQYVMPAIPPGTFFNWSSGAWDSPGRNAASRPFSSLRSATLRVVQNGGNPVLTVMVADGSGVYELAPGAGGWAVTWMMPREAYLALRRSGADVPSGTNPNELDVAFARRLDSGDVLIVNRYAGRRRNGDAFFGEVIQIAAEDYNLTRLNLGFRTASIAFDLPPIQGARGLRNPVFADRR